MVKKKGESRVKIYHDWCKGCGICVAFCPAGVLRLNDSGKAEVVNEDECINCGFCEMHCPDFAIMVYPREQKDKGSVKSLSAGGKAPAIKEEAAPENAKT
ncbi:MAG: 4Fe-4S dicluster domain-containing protein [Desulfonatronovibrionaceae bacterium]